MTDECPKLGHDQPLDINGECHDCADEYEAGVMDDPVQLVVRIPKSLLKRLDHFAVEQDWFRGQAVAVLLAEALDARERMQG